MRVFKFFIFIFLLINTAIFAQDTIRHKVSKGESFSLIAKKYNVKQKEIYSLNPKTEGKILKLNAILLIPTNKYQDSILTTNKLEHKVVSGESLYKISKKYEIPIERLKLLNPTVSKNLPIGFSLILKEEKNLIVKTDSILIGKTEIIMDSISTNLELSMADQLIDFARQNLGIKYKRGGTNTKGFDCSGLLFSTFKELNLNLPRTSFAQAQIGTKVEPFEAKKGDLIFFATNKRDLINHVGIITEIIGDEIKFIHSSLKLGVTISSTKESYYSKRLKQINSVLNSLF